MINKEANKNSILQGNMRKLKHDIAFLFPILICKIGYFFFKNVIYVSMTVLGLHCLSGFVLVVVPRLLIVASSLVEKHRP